MLRNKRGQVFLMAAVIIVGLIFGASRTLNYVSAGSDQEAFFDLTDELDFEVKRVLDYGVLNNPENLEQLTLSILDEYTENIVNEEVVYVIGNKDSKLKAVHYENINNPSLVTLNIGSSLISVPIQLSTPTFADIYRDEDDNKVIVTINSIPYEFYLSEGEVLYFVIIKDDNEEKFVSR